MKEAKKLLGNLNKMIGEYERLSCCKKFMNEPTNKEFKNAEHLSRIDRRMSEIESIIFKHINF